jgi:hypothetical protein
MISLSLHKLPLSPKSGDRIATQQDYSPQVQPKFAGYVKNQPIRRYDMIYNVK